MRKKKPIVVCRKLVSTTGFGGFAAQLVSIGASQKVIVVEFWS